MRVSKATGCGMMRGAEKRGSAAWFWQSKEELGTRSRMEICTRIEDACRQETRKSGRAPEGKHAGRSFSIQMSGDDVCGEPAGTSSRTAFRAGRVEATQAKIFNHITAIIYICSFIH